MKAAREGVESPTLPPQETTSEAANIPPSKPDSRADDATLTPRGPTQDAEQSTPGREAADHTDAESRGWNEAVAFFGQNATDQLDYVRQRLRAKGGFGAFNMAAFVFSLLWVGYRKMVGVAVWLIVALATARFAQDSVLLVYFGRTESPLFGPLAFVGIALSGACGISGNVCYRRRFVRVVERLQETDPDRRIEHLGAYGRRSFLSAFLVLFCALAVFISVGFGVRRLVRILRPDVSAIRDVGGWVYFSFESGWFVSTSVMLRELDPADRYDVTDASLEHLSRMTSLKQLTMEDMWGITDGGLKHLKGLINLESLVVRQSYFTGSSLEHLKGLPDLRVVSLSRCGIIYDDLESFEAITGLETTGLHQCSGVTDEGLVHLKGLTKLERLYLDGTKVTDAGLDHVKGLTSLKMLSLHDTRVTDAGVNGLQQTLPTLTINR